LLPITVSEKRLKSWQNLEYTRRRDRHEEKNKINILDERILYTNSPMSAKVFLI
jgi:hypothetical protein